MQEPGVASSTGLHHIQGITRWTPTADAGAPQRRQTSQSDPLIFLSGQYALLTGRFPAYH